MSLDPHQIENIKQLLLDADRQNWLVALHILTRQEIPDELLSFVLAVYTYQKEEAVLKLAKKILLANGSKKLATFLRQHTLQSIHKYTDFQWVEYIHSLEEQKLLPSLPLLEYWYKQSDGQPLYLKLYTQKIAALPPQERADYAQQYWQPRLQEHGTYTSVIIKMADGLLLEDLMTWKAPMHIIAVPANAFLALDLRLIQDLEQLTLTASNEVSLPNKTETLHQLHTLKLEQVASVSRQGWNKIKALPNLTTLIISLPDDLMHPVGFYFFTLPNLKRLFISGSELILDFPIEKFANLEELYIESSTLIDYDFLFEKMNKLVYLKRVVFHQELEELYKTRLKTS